MGAEWCFCPGAAGGVVGPGISGGVILILVFLAGLGLPIVLAGFGIIENSKGAAIAAVVVSALLGALLLIPTPKVVRDTGREAVWRQRYLVLWAIGAAGAAGSLARVTAGKSRRFWGEAPEPDELGSIRFRPIETADGPGDRAFEAGDP